MEKVVDFLTKTLMISPVNVERFSKEVNRREGLWEKLC